MAKSKGTKKAPDCPRVRMNMNFSDQVRSQFRTGEKLVSIHDETGEVRSAGLALIKEAAKINSEISREVISATRLRILTGALIALAASLVGISLFRL